MTTYYTPTEIDMFMTSAERVIDTILKLLRLGVFVFLLYTFALPLWLVVVVWYLILDSFLTIMLYSAGWNSIWTKKDGTQWGSKMAKGATLL